MQEHLLQNYSTAPIQCKKKHHQKPLMYYLKNIMHVWNIFLKIKSIIYWKHIKCQWNSTLLPCKNTGGSFPSEPLWEKHLPNQWVNTIHLLLLLQSVWNLFASARAVLLPMQADVLHETHSEGDELLTMVAWLFSLQQVNCCSGCQDLQSPTALLSQVWWCSEDTVSVLVLQMSREYQTSIQNLKWLCSSLPKIQTMAFLKWK